MSLLEEERVPEATTPIADERPWYDRACDGHN